MQLHRRWLALVTIATLVAVFAPTVASGAFVSPQAVVWWEDKWEPDNSPAKARTLPAMSRHTLDEVDDQDWMVFQAKKGQMFSFEALINKVNPMGNDIDYGDADTQIYIWRKLSSGETTLVAGNDDSWGDFDTYTSSLTYEATATGTYYADVHELDEDDRLSYTLYWNEGIGRRVSGPTRYDTAIAVSKVCFPMNGQWWYGIEDPERIVIASGESYSDAIAGAAFAGGMDGMLLLTPPDYLPGSVAREIERLWTDEYILGEDEDLVVYILGGKDAISREAAIQISSIDLVSDVILLGGGNRYRTAAKIAEEFDDYEGINTTACVVNGSAWQDGLSAVPVAAENDWPILYTMKTDVPSETMNAIADLGITDVIVVGGTGSVGGAAFNELETALGVGHVTRIGGSNRYVTSRRMAMLALANGMDGEAMVLASGESWADAATGGLLAYWADSPLLITDPNTLSNDVRVYMDSAGIPDMSPSHYGLGDYVGQISYLVGGSSAVSDDVFEDWASYY